MCLTCASREHYRAVTQKQLVVLGAKRNSVQETTIIHEAPLPFSLSCPQNTISSSPPARWLLPCRPLLTLLPAERSCRSRRGSAGCGREPVMAYFGVGDEQKREGKSRLGHLHLSEQLHVKSGRTNRGKPIVCHPLFLETA